MKRLLDAANILWLSENPEPIQVNPTIDGEFGSDNWGEGRQQPTQADDLGLDILDLLSGRLVTMRKLKSS